ncbi:hypothetical protein LAZ67_5003123 [Cordylochernes scorpioides]|uniref:Uncharacterized protein n=1 Tax=Cordylochernes scorpioides TaxID=51811 RepID=A0ABY6KH04_9ARAC|nr:hypothetical protein LAZ67_5003123 [Cordylochernes scorpioides]
MALKGRRFDTIKSIIADSKRYALAGLAGVPSNDYLAGCASQVVCSWRKGLPRYSLAVLAELPKFGLDVLLDHSDMVNMFAGLSRYRLAVRLGTQVWTSCLAGLPRYDLAFWLGYPGMD